MNIALSIEFRIESQESQVSSSGVNTESSGSECFFTLRDDKKYLVFLANNVDSNSLPSQCTSYTSNTQYGRNAAYTSCTAYANAIPIYL